MRTYRWLCLTVLAALVGGFLAPTGAGAAQATVERIAGATRYETSAMISRAAFPSGASRVVIASGATYADALSAGPSAAQMGGSLVLTDPMRLSDATAQEIARLRPLEAIIVGGTGAVSAAVERAVRAIIPQTRRVSGPDRYATSNAVVLDAFTEGSRSAYLATGANFPDALSAGAAGAVAGVPLLLADPARTEARRADLMNALQELGAVSVTVVGGEGAVSRAYVDELHDAGITVDRVSGADRYAVSARLAGRVPSESGAMVVATGAGFADALAATVFAGVRQAPIVLTPALCATPTHRAVLAARSPSRIIILGGPAVIRGLVVAAEPCRSTTDAASAWVLVNKRNPLRPSRYVPADLVRVNAPGNGLMRREAAEAMARMIRSAGSDGVGSISVLSSYRSYDTQSWLYAGYVRDHGQAWADLSSAREGHSEH